MGYMLLPRYAGLRQNLSADEMRVFHGRVTARKVAHGASRLGNTRVDVILAWPCNGRKACSPRRIAVGQTPRLFPARVTGDRRRMPRTYTNLLFHIVFATKERFPFIVEEHRERLYEYIGGTIRGLNGICIEIGGVADHIHIIVRLKPNHDVSKFLQELKPSATKWARVNVHPKFEWQDGFGAFTIGESQIPGVRSYIQNQKEHHRKTLFEDEFKEMLTQAAIEFDERYLWS